VTATVAAATVVGSPAVTRTESVIAALVSVGGQWASSQCGGLVFEDRTELRWSVGASEQSQ
jgi:hypothetical protein